VQPPAPTARAATVVSVSIVRKLFIGHLLR
jgi:hypothetical protein